MKTWFVCSGGAAKGAYGVGVLKNLILERNISFDGFAGTSVGALIAAHQVMFSNDEKELGYEDLEKLFLSVETEDIWKKWFLVGYLAGLWKSSLVNSDPLYGLIRDMLDEERVKKSGRQLRVTAVNLNTSELEVFNQSFSPLWQPVAASASIPALFSPVGIKKNQHAIEHQYVDGGVRVYQPIKMAIDAGAERIFAVSLSPEGYVGEFDPEGNAIDIGLRSLDAALDELADRDIKMAQLYNRLLDAQEVPGKRKVEIHRVVPKTPLLEDSTHFVPKLSKEIWHRGWHDASTQIGKL